MKAREIEEFDKEHSHKFLDKELDPYPACDPDLIGSLCSGDCCPRCGESLKFDEKVIRFDGVSGEVLELAEDDASVPLYHPFCYRERMAEASGQKQNKLEDYK